MSTKVAQQCPPVSWPELWGIQEARDWMLAHGIPCTPEKLASFLREKLAQRGRLLPGASVAEITRAVSALLTHNNITHKEETTMKTDRRFAVPQKYFETPAANFDLEAPLPGEVPTSQGEADALERLRTQLIAAMPSLDRGDRVKAEDRVLAIEDLLRRWRKLDQIERART